MWHKSAFAFVLFHGALLLILGSVLAGERHRSRLVLLAFAIVVIGAVPAPFRYPELAMLQIPVVGGLAPPNSHVPAGANEQSSNSRRSTEHGVKAGRPK